MSKISREGYEQIKVIKNALDSMYDKLNNADLYSKDESRKVSQTECKNLQNQSTYNFQRKTKVFQKI